jgi:hypothetical protein
VRKKRELRDQISFQVDSRIGWAQISLLGPPQFFHTGVKFELKKGKIMETFTFTSR